MNQRSRPSVAADGGRAESKTTKRAALKNDPHAAQNDIFNKLLGSEVKLLKSWKLANGEVLEGKCVEVTATSANARTLGAPESYPPQPNLAFAWDAIFGSGYFAAHILGGKVWQGIFKGNQGTVLQVEMREQLGPERNNDRYRGAAVDNKGNVYKVVW